MNGKLVFIKGEEGEDALSDIDTVSLHSRSSTRASSTRSRTSSSHRSTLSTRSRQTTASSLHRRAEERALQQRQHELEDELSTVTKKLIGKYHRGPHVSKSGGVLKDLAKAWHESDAENHQALYMKGCYVTASDAQFYAKRVDMTAERAQYHRTRKMHSKYGDALARCRIALRGRF